ncbi:unnamed protein product [Didymodactylos carnosus]|uniref:Uncharacterized protein n=1 Tax=Didymodactylos carnosus TaxID=1234261 RepID=A0A816CR74_9BILA|nr:unnamed protein product [Didymodactylos carnosus]CAF4518609.1 unnamed protein product [Didymodactylos carnosus]
MDQWKLLYPNWEIKLWSQNNLFSLYNEERYKQSRSRRQQADIIRYELVFQYGGIYVDVDFEPLKNMEPLLHGVKAFVAYEGPQFVCNGCFGSIPGHELVTRLMTRLDSNWLEFENGSVNQQTGSLYMSKEVEKLQLTMADGFQVFSPHVFFPYVWNEPDPGRPYDPLSYAVHHFRSLGENKKTSLTQEASLIEERIH